MVAPLRCCNGGGAALVPGRYRSGDGLRWCSNGAAACRPHAAPTGRRPTLHPCPSCAASCGCTARCCPSARSRGSWLRCCPTTTSRRVSMGVERGRVRTCAGRLAGWEGGEGQGLGGTAGCDVKVPSPAAPCPLPLRCSHARGAAGHGRLGLGRHPGLWRHAHGAPGRAVSLLGKSCVLGCGMAGLRRPLPSLKTQPISLPIFRCSSTTRASSSRSRSTMPPRCSGEAGGCLAHGKCAVHGSCAGPMAVQTHQTVVHWLPLLETNGNAGTACPRPHPRQPWRRRRGSPPPLQARPAAPRARACWVLPPSRRPPWQRQTGPC